MTLTDPSEIVFQGWGALATLPIAKQLELREKLQTIQLAPGEELNDFDHLPPGIVRLEQGKVRLLALDQNKQPFTLKLYTEGQFFGVEQILRGIKGQSLAASTSAKLSILPADVFLDLIQTIPELHNEFCIVSPNELYSVSAQRDDLKVPHGIDLLNWAKQECSKGIKVTLLSPGEHQLNEEWGEWLLSSSNIEGIDSGSLLRGPIDLKVSGLLPARLVPLPTNWPPNTDHNLLETKPSNSSTHGAEAKSASANHNANQLQRESLEDWYGKLREDKSYPQQNGQGSIDEPLACMRMLARYFDIPFRRDLLRRVMKDQLQRSNTDVLGLQQLAAICDFLGLRPTLLQPSGTDLLKRLPLPVLTILNGHPLLIWEQKKGQLLIGDPLNGQHLVTNEDFIKQLNGEKLSILYLESSPSTPKARFGLSWFLPAIRKHKSSLLQVVAASFFVQLLGLFNPLLIQQIIDAVISQGNLKSLNVLGTLLLVMALAQALLGTLRTYLFADTTNRIDISLGAWVINHLIRLPLGYFAKRPVGEVTSRVGELERIRSFLTGTALTVVLDSIFSVIYIAVMLNYSVQLTLWALAVVPFFIALTIGVAPVIRGQLRKQAEANARVQSHLVETLTGIETVKGQSMELPTEWRWEQFYSRQIQAGFRNTITSTAASSTSQLLQQVSGLLVIWMGAMLVLDGKLTLGQLIAFRILSGYVTSPLLRLATLWQNFQETALSLERLSDIVDNPQEIEITGRELPPLPPINGAITYESVDFRFSNKGPLQLLNVNFEISAGNFVGIVGSSGSGKSTLIKLITRLFDPIEGKIRIDGFDISKVDLYSLRTQLGVVPQDSLLFDGSVQENIALTRPDANFEDICKAAKIACADEFIQSLPRGYNSPVGERGAGLSGGQRQRIAIARMILKKPKLLVLDEATSALDIDTEKRLISNLMETYSNSTVMFVSHRLNTLCSADQILVMHQGVLEEIGTHSELMSLGGRYATLFRQQEAISA